jgi:hypothetical protein
MNQPSPKTIARFIEVFETFSHFESTQRFTRKYGAFKENELPIPEVVETIEWLRSLTNEDSKTKAGWLSLLGKQKIFSE